MFHDDYLIFLKRYNSWYALVPELAISYGTNTRVVNPLGGGYLLATKEGTLISIDPGPKYLEALNLYSSMYSKCKYDQNLAKLRWSDIRTVVITHFHIDHYLSILNLISLFYKWNESRNTNTKLTILGSKLAIRHLVEIIRSFRSSKIPLKKYADYFALSSDGREFDLNSKLGDEIRKLRLAGISIEATKTDHLEVRNRRDGGVGLLMRVEKGHAIGITGDTTYSKNISKQFINTKMVICHVGDFDETIGCGPVHNHMKLGGARKLINDCCPELAILTEFDANDSSRRLDAAKGVSCPKSTVLVGDIGMTIRLSDLKIKCASCGSFEDFHEISQAFDEEPFTNDCVAGNFCRKCQKKRKGRELTNSREQADRFLVDGSSVS